jgi:hypothetical protein
MSIISKFLKFKSSRRFRKIGRVWFLAAPQGFEPRYADPESAVLPLNEGATSAEGHLAAEPARLEQNVQH